MAFAVSAATERPESRERLGSTYNFATHYRTHWWTDLWLKWSIDFFPKKPVAGISFRFLGSVSFEVVSYSLIASRA